MPYARAMLLAFVVATVLGLLTRSLGRADGTPVQVTITAENCREDRGAVPSLSYAGVRGEKIHDVAARGRFLTRDSYQFTIAVQPGHQHVLVRSKNCDADILLSTLPAHNRHMHAALTELLPLYQADCSLAGTLPPAASAVMLTSPGEQDVQADVDEGAYYIDHIRPAKHTLRVALAGGKMAEIPLDLSGVETHQTCDQLFVHNITSDELAKASSKSQPHP